MLPIEEYPRAMLGGKYMPNYAYYEQAYALDGTPYTGDYFTEKADAMEAFREDVRSASRVNFGAVIVYRVTHDEYGPQIRHDWDPVSSWYDERFYR